MRLLLFALAILCAPFPLWAQNPDNTFVLVDPPDALIDPVSIAEFNTEGDTENWNANQTDSVTVSEGTWKGLSSGGDSFMEKTLDEEVDVSTTPRTVIEFRLKRSAEDVSNLQIFWGDVNGGYEEPARRATITAENIPADGEFHVYRMPLWGRIKESLRQLRIDPTIVEGTELEVDYIRFGAAANERTLTIDPPEAARVNFYVSLGEFNTEEDFEGWNPVQVVATVNGGSLNATATGTDAILDKQGINLQTSTGNYNILEIRLKREESDATSVDIFINDDYGNYSEPTKIPIGGGEIPADGEYHILQVDATQRWAGLLRSLRMDPTSNETGRAFSVDYVRLGIVAPDGDNDGLPDRVETNTGLFVDASDTGTDPAKADTDGDGYNDGVEVMFGTNPNSAASKPSASLDGYTQATPSYVLNTAIPANQPISSNGTVTGYTVAPALPAGLALDPVTGIISGTPSALQARTTHTVTASFQGAPADTFGLSIEVVNPGIVSYTLNPARYKAGQDIGQNAPLLLGPAPDSFSISPALPDGLVLDEATGILFGTPEVSIPPTPFTVTADYAAYPDMTFVLSMEVVPTPALVLDPAQPINIYESLGEFNTPDEFEDWRSFNIDATNPEGIAIVTSRADDPQIFKSVSYDMSTEDYPILEFRLRRSDNDQRLQIFWGDESGGLSEERSFIIQPGGFPDLDDEFHVYQIVWPGVISGMLDTLRIDDGDSPGRTSEFDYIRLGRVGTTAGTNVSLTAALLNGNSIVIKWPASAPAGLKLQSSPSMAAASWADVTAAPNVENGENVVVEPINAAAGPRRFYRLVQP